MQSSFYGYYYIAKEDLSDYWHTKKIEEFIINKQNFLIDSKGSFKHKEVFLSLNLMMVKSFDSWSSVDYNCYKTNYINVVTSKILEPVVKIFFEDLENFTGSIIVEEK